MKQISAKARMDCRRALLQLRNEVKEERFTSLARLQPYWGCSWVEFICELNSTCPMVSYKREGTRYVFGSAFDRRDRDWYVGPRAQTKDRLSPDGPGSAL